MLEVVAITILYGLCARDITTRGGDGRLQSDFATRGKIAGEMRGRVQSRPNVACCRERLSWIGAEDLGQWTSGFLCCSSDLRGVLRHAPTQRYGHADCALRAAGADGICHITAARRDRRRSFLASKSTHPASLSSDLRTQSSRRAAKCQPLQGLPPTPSP